MPVRYGIIGCGAIAQRRHMPEAAANPASTVAALADPVAKRVKALGEEYGAEAYTDYRKMLKEAELDAVVVCGPNSLHAKMSIEAFKAGLHVLCEKPMATTRQDAKKMIAAARRASRYLMIGLNQRLMPPHVRAREILESGRLGKVIGFRTTFKHGGPDAWSIDGAKSWFFKKEAAFMGATGDLGVHKADLMRWLLREEFVEVGGRVTTLDKRDTRGRLIPLDDNAVLALKSRSGVLGSLEVSWTNYGGEENFTVIYGTRGVLSIGTDPTYGVIIDYANGDRELHQVGEMASNVKQVASGVIDSFTECIQKRRKPSIDGVEGYRCLDVILTAMDAARDGRFKKIQQTKL